MARSGTLTVRVIGDTRSFQKAMGGVGSIARGAGKVAAAGFAAAGAAAGLAIRAYAGFDAKLTESLAIMGDVSDEMRGEMSDAAREVAKTTTFSAEQAAESYFFLASAGMDAEAAVAAMPQVAKFAQAGMFDMATATDLATDAQSALGLASDDTEENLENLTRVSDVFVKANTLANASVEEFATAMTQKAGSALRSVGKDIEEGTATLAVFADQGIKGERAGTILRATLDGLSENARKNEKAFNDLGVSVFDSEGNMRNMADITADLEGGLAGMSVEQREAALSQLGFNQRSREGILALLGNSESLAEYEEQLREAGGTAEEVADNQLDSLSGQWELLKSRVGDVALELGQKLEPHVRDIVEAMNSWLEENEDVTDSIADGIGGAIVKLKEWAGWIRNQFAAHVEDGFTPMQAAMETAKDLGDRVKDMLPKSVTDNVEGLAGGFVLLLGPLALIARELFPLIKPALDAIIPPLAELANALVPIFAQGISDVVDNILPGLVDILGTVIEWLGENGGFVMALGIAGIAFKIFSLIVAANPFVLLATAVVAIAALIVTHWDEIVEFLSGVWEWIKTTAGTVWGAIRDAFQKAFDFVKNMFLNFTPLGLIIKNFDKIKEGVTGVWTWIKDKFQAAVDFVKNLFLNFTPLGIILSRFDRIKAAATGVKDWISDKINDVVGFFRDMPGRIGRVIGGLFDGIKTAFKAAINWVIDKWNNFSFSGGFNLPAIFGGGRVEVGFDTPNIPRLHTGGIFNAPTPGGEGLALLQDQERVVPAGGGDINVHVQTNANPFQIADAVSWRMRTQGV